MSQNITKQEPISPTNPVPTDNPTPPINFSKLKEAYLKRLPEIQAVKDDELITLNIDVHNAVTTVRGALPQLKALLGDLGKLYGLNQDLITGLDEYSQAAGYANSQYVIATTPGEDIVALNDTAMKIRETLRSDATALANRGLIDSARLNAFKGLVGYKNVAFDLIDYASLLQDCWPSIQGKTALSAEEIEAAAQLGERLVDAAGEREQGPAVVIETARLRQQALTLMVNAYDETRRGVLYLRWHQDDGEVIAPSLYGGRTRHQADAPPSPTPPAPTPPTPAPPVVAAPNGNAAPAPLGYPTANPFGGH